MRTRLTEALDIEHPVMLAGMGGVSYHALVAAVSDAGGFGCLGASTMPADELVAEMRAVKARTDKPFGVDLLTALPEQMLANVELVVREGASVFVAGLGVPRDAVRLCHDHNVIVMSMCGKVRHALAAVEAGCDIVVAQGTEAGGHTGTVATMPLVPQIVDAVGDRTPVVAAGGIFDGRGLAASLALGADGVWIGTRFIATPEARSTPGYKDALLRSAEDGTVVSRAFTGKTLRAVRNAQTQYFEDHPEELKRFPDQIFAAMQGGWMHLGGDESTPGVDPDRECYPAGQGVGAIDALVPAGELVQRIVAEADAMIDRLAALARVTERLVVVGGDAGGMAAAATARRRRPQDQLEIVAFERGTTTSYSACGIPYFVGGLIVDVNELVARTPDEHRASGIDVRVRHEVAALDVGRGTVHVVDLAAGVERDEPFDALVLATGATPIRPDIPGISATGVFGVQTLADGLAVHDAIDGARERSSQRAVVVGGGYVGLEMAEALVRRRLDVTVVEAGPAPMGATLDADVGGLVADALRGLGITLHTDEPVEAIEFGARGVRAVVTAERTVPADLVVLGLGVRPNVALAETGGVALGASGAVATDAAMRTSADRVWAAGDCVEVYHRVSRGPTRIALGTHANKQGRVAGITATGGEATFPGVLGTAVTRVCDYEIGRTGLTEHEAAHAGLDFDAETIDATTRAGYLPDAQPIRVKVVFERGRGRLLGAQIFGREGASKRIDVLAVCLWNEMTVDEIVSLDLGYAPPVSPLWDPVLVAARRAAASLAR